MSIELLDYLFLNRTRTSSHKISPDLIKAFLIALGFHILFIAIFKISSPHIQEDIPSLPFSAVEIDLGEKKSYHVSISNEVVLETSLVFPEENPMSLLFSLNYLDQDCQEKWMKRPNSLVNPDFSSLEILPYTSRDAL